MDPKWIFDSICAYTQEVLLKKQKIQEKVEAERLAMVQIQKEGALCIFKDVDGVRS